MVIQAKNAIAPKTNEPITGVFRKQNLTWEYFHCFCGKIERRTERFAKADQRKPLDEGLQTRIRDEVPVNGLCSRCYDEMLHPEKHDPHEQVTTIVITKVKAAA